MVGAYSRQGAYLYFEKQSNVQNKTWKQYSMLLLNDTKSKLSPSMQMFFFP